MSGWRVVGLFSLITAAALGTSGCGPSISREELGEVVFEVPKIAPKEEPVAKPQADAGAEDAKDEGED
jgi:hypothetical protein